MFPGRLQLFQCSCSQNKMSLCVTPSTKPNQPPAHTLIHSLMFTLRPQIWLLSSPDLDWCDFSQTDPNHIQIGSDSDAPVRVARCVTAARPTEELGTWTQRVTRCFRSFPLSLLLLLLTIHATSVMPASLPWRPMQIGHHRGLIWSNLVNQTDLSAVFLGVEGEGHCDLTSLSCL